MKPKRCPYYKKCKLYSEESRVCTEEEGFYGSHLPGCYKEMARLGK